MLKEAPPWTSTWAAEIQEYYSHSRPSGDARTIVKDGMVIVTGENIAAGYESADEVMEGWTNSLSHYENMTYDAYQSYACACFITYDDTYGWPFYTWVQLFTFDKLINEKKEDEPTKTNTGNSKGTTDSTSPSTKEPTDKKTFPEEPSEVIYVGSTPETEQPTEKPTDKPAAGTSTPEVSQPASGESKPESTQPTVEEPKPEITQPTIEEPKPEITQPTIEEPTNPTPSNDPPKHSGGCEDGKEIIWETPPH